MHHRSRCAYRTASPIPFFERPPVLDSHLNTWGGFPCHHRIVPLPTPAEIAELEEVVLYHVRRWLCSDSEGVYTWLMRFLAHMIREPNSVSGVYVILQSRAQGIGKDLFVELLREAVGDWNTVADKFKRMGGEFNGIYEGKLLLYFPEVHGIRDDELRALVTSKDQVYNHKNEKQRTARSFARYIFSTNSDQPVRIEAEDRRLRMIEGDTALLQMDNRIEYFRQLRAVTTRPRTAEVLFHYLAREVDLPEGWHPSAYTIVDAGGGQLTLKSKFQGEEGRILFLLVRGALGTLGDLTGANPALAGNAAVLRITPHNPSARVTGPQLWRCYHDAWPNRAARLTEQQFLNRAARFLNPYFPSHRAHAGMWRMVTMEGLLACMRVFYGAPLTEPELRDLMARVGDFA